MALCYSMNTGSDVEIPWDVADTQPYLNTLIDGRDARALAPNTITGT